MTLHHHTASAPENRNPSPQRPLTYAAIFGLAIFAVSLAQATDAAIGGEAGPQAEYVGSAARAEARAQVPVPAASEATDNASVGTSARARKRSPAPSLRAASTEPQAARSQRSRGRAK